MLKKTEIQLMQIKKPGFILFLGVLAMVSGCSAVGDKLSQLSGAPSSGGSGTPEGPGMKVASAPPEAGAVSISNFRQILGSMATTMGLRAPSACVVIYKNGATTFPKYGEAKELTAPEEVNKVSLASCVCDGVYSKEMSPANAASRIFLKGVDFLNGTSPTTLVSAAGDSLAKSAWGRSPDSNELGMMQDMVAAVDSTNPAGKLRTPAELLQARWNAMCTVVLASYEAQKK